MPLRFQQMAKTDELANVVMHHWHNSASSYMFLHIMCISRWCRFVFDTSCHTGILTTAANTYL